MQSYGKKTATIVTRHDDSALRRFFESFTWCLCKLRGFIHFGDAVKGCEDKDGQKIAF